MPTRYLFGPVSADFVGQKLHTAVQAGQCIPFDAAGRVGFRVDVNDTWESIHSRLPKDSQPDFIVLNLAYNIIPPVLWTIPVPIVALACDWNLLWHGYRYSLRQSELILTDTVGVETLARDGINHARAANLYGFDRAYLEIAPAEKRDIDLLFIGNLNTAVQRERLTWLGRLARQSDRWRVEIHTNVYGPTYRKLLSRSRIVFNRAIRQECNQRAFEAIAAGALLFQEAGNREIDAYLQPNRDYIPYSTDNFDALLTRYLEHEDERQTIAASAQKLASSFSYEALWNLHLSQIERELPGMIARMAQRPRDGLGRNLLARTWQAVSANSTNPSLIPTLTKALSDHPRDGALHHALALARSIDCPLVERRLRSDRDTSNDTYRPSVQRRSKQPLARTQPSRSSHNSRQKG